jgi:hypothetical protein
MMELLLLSNDLRVLIVSIATVVILLMMRMGPFNRQKRSIDLFIIAFLFPTVTGLVGLVRSLTGSFFSDFGIWTSIVLPAWYAIESVLFDAFLIAGMLRIGYGKLRVSLANLLAVAVLVVSGFAPWASDANAPRFEIRPLSLSWYSDVRNYPLWLFIASVTLYAAIYLTLILSMSAEIPHPKLRRALGGSCMVLSAIPTFTFAAALLSRQSGTVGATSWCGLPLISTIIIFYMTFLHQQNSIKASPDPLTALLAQKP